MTELLLEAGLVTDEQIRTGLALQATTRRRIGETLVEMGVVTEADICWALSHQLDIPFVDVEANAPDPELLKSFPEELLERVHALPLVRTEQSVSIALADPTDQAAIEELEHVAGAPLLISIAAPSAIDRTLSRAFGRRMEARSLRPRSEEPAYGVEWDRSGATFLDFHLELARRAGATEIHFLPGADTVRVLHRVSGRLIHTANEAPHVIYALLARLEALGGPAFDGHDLHTCGTARTSLGGTEYELRISILHQDAGVAVVLAISQARLAQASLFDLGFDLVEEARIRAVLAGPSGLAVVCGPAGSGVSTTLAALFALAATEGRRALAIRDHAAGVFPHEQSLELDPDEARRTWEGIAVRHDVDVLALDGILEGPHVASLISAATSGRWLIAGTDWGNADALIDHLLALPGGRATLAGRLRLVVQIRLARARSTRRLGVPSADSEPLNGRVPLIEAYAVTAPMIAALRGTAGSGELAALAHQDGVVSLAERVRQAVAEERITPDEAARVLG